MIEPKITTLETARMLDETTTLLDYMAGACDYLCCTTALISHNELINNKICGVFGILSYAADAAHTKQENYQCEFMKACGFVLTAAPNISIFEVGEGANVTVVGVVLNNALGYDAVRIEYCGVFVHIP